MQNIYDDYKGDKRFTDKFNPETKTLTFESKDQAIDFFKKQADKGRALDFKSYTEDHRVYSDGKGNFVQGTNDEVQSYIDNPDQFKIGEKGALSSVTPADSLMARAKSPFQIKPPHN